jgi:3-oxoacyl-[acyl-carrier-protein] synthase-3
MNHVEIKGYGTSLPEQTVHFEDQTRYRISGEETQLRLAVEASERALKKADCTIDDIDCIVAASAVGIQPIPCTAALIHEQLAQGLDIPAMDINTTCTSFVTALDMVSYLIEAGRYKTVLIVASETGSLGLNPKQKESYELFSDGAAAMIITQTTEDKGILYSLQRTWSEGAHATEIRGGLTNFHPKFYTEATKEEYMFDMQGPKIISLTIKKLPAMFQEFLEKSGLQLSEIDQVIPHQASRAMPLLMKKLGIQRKQYIDLVDDYGNMVSVSIPFALCQALDEGRVQSGNTVVLLGTAAGLTTNMLALKL